jgi:hypothetical protein
VVVRPQDYSGFGLKPQKPTPKSAQLASHAPVRAAWACESARLVIELGGHKSLRATRGLTNLSQEGIDCALADRGAVDLNTAHARLGMKRA